MVKRSGKYQVQVAKEPSKNGPTEPVTETQSEARMSELQATLEFSVELNKFYNVDLFQRGFYQIRTALRTPPKVPSKIEITLQKSQGQENEIPAHVINDMAVSRTFQILYRSEDLVVNDVILYRCHTLVNSTQMEEEMSKLEIQLLLELWFSDEQAGTSGALSKAECVSQRTINIHFSPTKGLHHHVPILFDYFHLCCVEVTVHGTLIAIHQPFLSVPKQPKTAWSQRNPDQSTLETVYFGERSLSADPEQCLPMHLHAAWQMHHRICNVLLSAYESLQTTFELYLGDICGSQFKLEHIDCHAKLQKIMDSIRDHDNEEEMIQNATRDITQLCAANVILWTQFLETATLDQGIIFHLAKEHHNARIKRLAEGFFTHEYQKNECLACYEPSFHGHSDLASMVRSSMYLQTLPSLDLECLDLDGDNNTLPIIFEDIYYDQAAINDSSDQRRSRSSSLSPSFSQNSSPQARLRPKRNFIKNIRPDTFKRPSSFNLKEAEAQGTRGPKNVELVGYRKTVALPQVPGRMVELGTFSPAHSNTSSPKVPHSMPNSLSMSALDREGWSRNSDSTLPEYMMVARRSLRAKKKKKKSSIITVDFGGSDPELKADNEGSTETTHRLKRAYTDPARRVSSSSDKSNPDTSISPVESQSTSSQAESQSISRETSMATESDETSDATKADSTAKKQLDFQDVLYQNLSECLTKALGDDGINDSDKSDDETCIQNGYDEFLETGTESRVHDSPEHSGEEHSTEHSSQGNQRTDLPKENTCSTPQTSNLTVRDILKNNVLQLSAPGSQKPEPATNGTAPKELEDVLSISDVNLDRNGRTQTSGDLGLDETDSAITVTGSHSTLHDTDSAISLAGNRPPAGSTGSQSTLQQDGTLPLDGSHLEKVQVQCKVGDEVTVIELLKEEYKRSSVLLGADINKSISDFSDSGVSGVSVKNAYKSSSDSNILHAVDSESTDSAVESSKKSTEVMVTSASFPDMTKLSEPSKDHPRLVDKVRNSTISFINMRENLKSRMTFQGNLYSESSTLASQIPFFHVPDTTDDENQDGCHLIVCVHGLDGNSADLRLVKTYMEMALPGYRLEFLMSERNQSDTFADFDTMTKRLVSEVFHHIEIYSLKVARVSFVGHSLGTIIIRSALTHVEMIPLLPKLYTFLSLSGPHLGTLYNNSGLVNMGMWFMQKWKKSGSLLQLSLKDHPSDARQSFLYKLSQKPGLEFFRHVLLVGSSQDRYVPYHSSRIEMCKAAQRESTGLGSVYAEMVANILQPIVMNPRCKLIRYDVFHALPSTANTIIGRAAHIAVLDSELFIEKFLMVCGLKYFK